MGKTKRNVLRQAGKGGKGGCAACTDRGLQRTDPTILSQPLSWFSFLFSDGLAVLSLAASGVAVPACASRFFLRSGCRRASDRRTDPTPDGARVQSGTFFVSDKRSDGR